MSEIVYVLINEAMPGYVKVGKTTTSLEQRMKELSSSTSLPLPFTCFYACTVNNSTFVERQIHDAFDNNRPNKKREFFQIAPARIVAALKLAELEDITPIDDIEMVPEDRQALEKVRSERRGQFKFSLANIPIGAELVYINNHEIRAKVINDKSIELDGKETSLSASATKLLGYKNTVQGTAYWLYEGEILDERRKRLELEGSDSFSMEQGEVVLKAGAEGGSITLYGIRNNKDWFFGLNVVDQTPSFINESDAVHDSGVVNSWLEALELLDQYTWHELYPLEVHPEFRGKVFDAASTRVKSSTSDIAQQHLPNWKSLCLQNNNE
ncbi:GIY-YIG nuclease family protein [Acidovorax soli]|uniref:T5orf172 domain-containing protein n=1 Tax=Acidovorax soli TaxID=592050 RepID=A0A1H4B2Q1_9BURK|nr:GIY-YIG nuclease family protein [Acidovorax soli]SEA42433.1 T5orf172 domain-containing protein [Acidovorax soli]